MFSKPFIGVMFLAFLVWIGYCFLPADGSERINRACEPLSWSGRFLATTAGFFNATWEDQVLGTFRGGEMKCRALVWTQFYKKAWEEQQMQLRALREAARQAPGAVNP